MDIKRHLRTNIYILAFAGFMAGVNLTLINYTEGFSAGNLINLVGFVVCAGAVVTTLRTINLYLETIYTL